MKNSFSSSVRKVKKNILQGNLESYWKSKENPPLQGMKDIDFLQIGPKEPALLRVIVKQNVLLSENI